MKNNVNDLFKDDFNWMQRERKGLYPWVAHNYREAFRYTNYNCCEHPFCHGERISDNKLISLLLKNQILENQLFDIFQKAIMRAEIRLVSRFIPQQSNEERLTGNFISELDAAIFLIKPIFKKLTKQLYNEDKNIDFFYYDLSRGGKVENKTGADLGFIIVIDLPDFPYTVKSLVLQVKKCRSDGNAQIDAEQFNKINSFTNKSAYLFYDMNFRELSSPIVVDSYKLEDKFNDTKKNENDSFSIKMNEILSKGIPLSLYLLHDFINKDKGDTFYSFEEAFKDFKAKSNSNSLLQLDGRLAVVSLGKPIIHKMNNDGLLDLYI